MGRRATPLPERLSKARGIPGFAPHRRGTQASAATTRRMALNFANPGARTSPAHCWLRYSSEPAFRAAFIHLYSSLPSLGMDPRFWSRSCTHGLFRCDLVSSDASITPHESITTDLWARVLLRSFASSFPFAAPPEGTWRSRRRLPVPRAPSSTMSMRWASFPPCRASWRVDRIHLHPSPTTAIYRRGPTSTTAGASSAGSRPIPFGELPRLTSSVEVPPPSTSPDLPSLTSG